MDRNRGLIAAALTPRGKRGELNFGAGFELIDHLCRAKVHGIALLTAAGEYPSFTIEERTRLVYLGAKRSRVPLLAGVGAEDLATAVELAREALTAGAQAVVLPPPLLFPYPKPEIHEFYLQFAGQVGSGAEIWIDGAPSPDDLLATGRFAGVAGAGMTLSPDACAIPELLVALESARRTHDHAREQCLALRAREFRDWAERFAPLVAVKVATEMRGIRIGSLPVPVAPERSGLLDQFRQWFRDWLPAMQNAATHA